MDNHAIKAVGNTATALNCVTLEQRVSTLENEREKTGRFVRWLIGILAGVVVTLGVVMYEGYSAMAERLIEVSRETTAQAVHVSKESDRKAADLSMQLARIEERLAALQWRLDALRDPGHPQPGR